MTDVPALGVSVSVDFGTGGNVVFQTHIAQDCPEDFLAEVIDRAVGAANRQRAAVEILAVCKKLREERQALKTTLAASTTLVMKQEQAEIIALARGRRNKPAPSTQDQMAERSNEKSLDVIRNNIRMWELRIDMLRRIMKGEASYIDLAFAELDAEAPRAAVA